MKAAYVNRWPLLLSDHIVEYYIQYKKDLHHYKPFNTQCRMVHYLLKLRLLTPSDISYPNLSPSTQSIRTWIPSGIRENAFSSAI